MKELDFNLLLDMYRKDLINMCTYNSNIQQRDYWREKSNDTYNRLIKKYNEKTS